MGIEETVIQEIVRRVTEAVPAERVILFGSAATQQMTRDSDIDLLIIEERLADPRAERLKVRRALMDMPYPFDIVLMTNERFEETKDVIGGIAYPAHKYGRIVYDAA